MAIESVEILEGGRPTHFDSVSIQGRVVISRGHFLRKARLEHEWFEDIEDPEGFVRELVRSGLNCDLFTFVQRLCHDAPKYSYHMELEDIAVLDIRSYEEWYSRQIDTNAKRAVRRAEKKGVRIEVREFDDDFIRGMVEVFNETPVRQGRLFPHYGKDYGAVKKYFSRYLFRETLIGAYYDGGMIGFAMLADAGAYAVLGQIISKLEHRDKAPNSALIGKAVELCAERGHRYLVYSMWDDGTLTEFKRRNGFRKVSLPRYYVPLTTKGAWCLRLGAHRGLKGVLPRPLTRSLKRFRNRWYEWKTLH